MSRRLFYFVLQLFVPPKNLLPHNEISELIIDAYGCKPDLSDVVSLERVARDAAAAVGAQVVESIHHRFQPHGLTLCLILKESHLIVSTWPEHQLAIVNIFLCNPSMDARQSWEVMERLLKPEEVIFHSVKHRVAPWKKAA